MSTGTEHRSSTGSFLRDDLARLDAAAAPRPVPGLPSSRTSRPAERVAAHRPTWQRTLLRTVVLADVAATVLGVGAGVLTYGVHTSARPASWFWFVVVAAVLLALSLERTRDAKVLGSGSEELRRVGRAALATLGTVAVVAIASKDDVGRLQALLAPLLAFTFVALGRVLCRRALHARRRAGACTTTVLAAGDPAAITNLAARADLLLHVGWRIEAACIPGSAPAVPGAAEVPVLGDLEDVAAVARATGVRVVAVLPSSAWTPDRLKRLGWDLEGTGIDLVVAPTFLEVAGPRLHVTPVLGLPLLHVSEPVLKGGRLLGKEVFDRAAAAAGLLLLAPVLLVLAVAVKLDSHGPVLFRQRRVGRDGSSFTMIKFRSMVADAEQVRVEMTTERTDSGPLFKVRKDPRITKVGATLRRYSLDELPQLLNVLAGTMSLVGPRPPLPAEVAQYEGHEHRRLLVKPGLTGLWQVSGRSDLSWEESVRLDLRYVENYSLALDATILWRTLSAVRHGGGAY